MNFKGNNLVLDNFRKVLAGYSVDIQDVVRSAILDGIDISEYVNECKNNPYRLDQIRLGIKEGIDVAFFAIKNGESIYKIRKLDVTSRKIVLSKVATKTLTPESLDKTIEWVEAGYDISNLKISIIPKNLYDVFEHGLQRGFNMRPFNDGRHYKPEFVKSCLMMMSNGKIDIGRFLGIDWDKWDDDCIRKLAEFSRIKSNTMWYKLLDSITPNTPIDKVESLIACMKSGIDIGVLSGNDWSGDSIQVILQAYELGLDYKSLIASGAANVNSNFNEMRLAQTKRISGRLRHR